MFTCYRGNQFLDWISSSCGVVFFFSYINLKSLTTFQCLLFHSCCFLSFMLLMQQSAKIPFGGPQFVVLLKTFEVEVRVV